MTGNGWMILGVVLLILGLLVLVTGQILLALWRRKMNQNL